MSPYLLNLTVNITKVLNLHASLSQLHKNSVEDKVGSQMPYQFEKHLLYHSEIEGVKTNLKLFFLLLLLTTDLTADAACVIVTWMYVCKYFNAHNTTCRLIRFCVEFLNKT